MRGDAHDDSDRDESLRIIPEPEQKRMRRREPENEVKQAEKDRDTQRHTDTGRGKQRQIETDRNRPKATGQTEATVKHWAAERRKTTDAEVRETCITYSEEKRHQASAHLTLGSSLKTHLVC